MADPWKSSDNRSLAVVSVIGAQWGDEGKGKLVDVLAASADVCCRFNGGSNAGHTLVVDGKTYALHLTPCGVLYPHTTNLLGNGVVIHLKTLLEEFATIEKHKPKASERVLISSRAHLLFDFHQLADGCQEAEKTDQGNAIGTTKRGIGPCYSDKMSRSGVRVHDLLEWNVFETKYRTSLSSYRKRYQFEFDEEEELNRHRQYASVLRDRIVDGVQWLHSQIAAGKKILVEGANATFLDVDFGTYPCVTSSSTTVGGICIGLGIPPRLLEQVFGVVKSYTTRVGEGPFMTELLDEMGARLRQNGQEFGTTTGRPRRCGWFDVPLIKFAAALNGFTGLNLTKLDVLTGIPVLKVCTAYRHKKTGNVMRDLFVPQSIEDYAQYEPVYEELPGWTEDISSVTDFETLPEATKNYVNKLEAAIGCSIIWVGVGASREQMLVRDCTAIRNGYVCV